jgi:hypothetical protein
MNAEQNTEQRVRENVAAMLDRATEAQDALTVAELARRRRRALDVPPRRGWLDSLSRWQLGGALAACAALVLAVVYLPVAPQVDREAAPDAEFAMLIEDPEFVQDLAFYSWLEQQDETREL